MNPSEIDNKLCEIPGYHIITKPTRRCSKGVRYLVYPCENCGKISERRMSSVYAVLKKTGRIPRFCSVQCISEALRLGKSKNKELDGIKKLRATRSVYEHLSINYGLIVFNICNERRKTKNFINIREIIELISPQEPEMSSRTIRAWASRELSEIGANRLNYHSGAFDIQNIKKE